MSLLKGKRKWKFMPFKSDSWGMYFDSPPCVFHRWMQFVFFGFRWVNEEEEK